MKYFCFLLSICFLWNTATAKVFYVDPANGSASGDGSRETPWKTIQQVVQNNLIESYSYVLPYNPKHPEVSLKNPGAPVKAGDTLLLFGGLHGELYLRGFVNKIPIIILAATGEKPVLKQIHLIGCKNWVLDGLSVSAEPYGKYPKGNLVFFETHNWHGPVSSVIMRNCEIFTAKEPWNNAAEWREKMANGISIYGDTITVENNVISNINFGIAARGEQLRVEGNSIVNFAGDGIRVLGSKGLYKDNVIMNCYKVNDNHDDGIQSYTTGGLRVDSNILSGNIILNYTNPEQALLGPLQGIGCFDGPYNDWVIENNIVMVEHWHGISFYGAHRCKIINNTVVDPTPDKKPGPSWIKIESHKNGSPSTDCIVKNNISNTLAIHAQNSLVGHNILLKSKEQYRTNFVDFDARDFHLRKGSICIDKGDDTYAPSKDKDGVMRPQGAHVDAGAYEYQRPTAYAGISGDQVHILMSPNPAQDEFGFSGIEGTFEVWIYDISGTLLRFKKDFSPSGKLSLMGLPKGVYIVKLKGEAVPKEYHFILVKK